MRNDSLTRMSRASHGSSWSSGETVDDNLEVSE
jgi:hypothetical protein